MSSSQQQPVSDAIGSAVPVPVRSPWLALGESLRRANASFRERLVEAAGWAEPPELHTQEEDLVAYGEWTRASNAATASLFFLGLSCVNLLWWTADTIVLHHTPEALEAFGQYRWVFSLATLLVGLLMNTRLTRRFPATIITLGGGSVIALVAYGMGLLGGPSQPWFHFVYLSLLPPIALSTTFPRRVLAHAFLGSVMTGGLLFARPDAMGDPYWRIYLSLLLCTLLFGLAAGTIAERHRKQTFLLRCTLARQAEDLQELTETLQLRVEERTEELRALTTYIESAREEERTTIARELHDELGQELGALQYTLARVLRRYRRDPAQIEPDLAELQQLVTQTSKTSRQLMLDLRPRVLDDLGLAAAAEWLVQRTEERTGIRCVLELPTGEFDVPPAISTAAFRILQESLTNVARHSQAETVQVELRVDGDALHLTVHDNGVGLSKTQTGRRGMGLIGMRERTQALGGELSLESPADGGTIVRARLPHASNGARPS